jgi:mitogen-activated protein kinase kinase kinase 3
MTPTATNKSSFSSSCSSNQGGKGQSIQQRRLTRQRRLCYPGGGDNQDGESFDSNEAVSFSLPSSPLRTSSDHWSSSAVPQPLPLPESPLTRHHHAALPFSR